MLQCVSIIAQAQPGESIWPVIFAGLIAAVIGTIAACSLVQVASDEDCDQTPHTDHEGPPVYHDCGNPWCEIPYSVDPNRFDC